MAAASKSFLTLGTLAFAMMFGGGVYVLSQLNTLAKPHAERIISDALGVKVSIGKMEISLKEKFVSASSIRVANPSGFSKPHAVNFQNVRITLNDVKQGLIDFKDISVTGTEVFLEVKNNTTNLQVLKNGLSASKKDGGAPINVIIRRFFVDTAQLNPSVTLISDQDLEPVSVSPFRTSNIGLKEGGIPAQDAAVQIMRPMLRSFASEAAGAGFYEGLSREALEDIGQNQIDAITDQIGNEIDKIGEGIKGLFQ